MLCVKPVDTTEELKKILEAVKILGSAPRVLIATENEKELGFVVVDPLKEELRIAELVISGCDSFKSITKEDLEIAEYLVRAAGSYALNRMIMKLSCDKEEVFDVLDGFAFKRSEGRSEIFLTNLFKKCDTCEKSVKKQ